MRYKSSNFILLTLFFLSVINIQSADAKAKSDVSPKTDAYETALKEGINFANPDYPSFIKSVSGISGYEAVGRWSAEAKATITFANPLPKAFRLHLEIGAAYGPNDGKPIKVRVGNWKGEFTIINAALKPIDLHIKTSHPADTIEFIIPEPASPKEFKTTGDPRQLGILFKQLSIQK